tara:strand:+ start:1206 stop:1436 length:231 start_codon:yes stop_codon:yes gene_type:complete
MNSYQVARLSKYKQSYTCQMCGKPKFTKMYEYQAYSFVSRYKPEYFTKICGDCIYKEVFGNEWRLNKRKGALDDII